MPYRKDGKVCRTYVGSMDEPVVQFISRSSSLASANRSALNKEVENDNRLYDSIAYDASECRELIRRMVDLRLGCAGIGLNKKWKMKNTRTPKVGTNLVPKSMTKEDFDELVALAEDGNETALMSLRQLIASDRESFSLPGDLSAHLQDRLINLTTRGNLLAAELIKGRLNEYRTALVGGDAHPVLALLVENVLTAWLDVQYRHLLTIECGLQQREYNRRQRHCSAATKRLHSALESLEEIRPIIQQ